MAGTNAPVRLCRLSDGAAIAYSVLGNTGPGSKTPLVMIMGLGGTMQDWGTYCYDLAKTRPVIILDNRGMGKSEWVAKPTDPKDRVAMSAYFRQPTVTSMATDVFDVLIELKLKRFHLLGFSLGGVIAQQLALLLRGRDDFELVSLVLMGTFAVQPRPSPLGRLLLDTQKQAENNGGKLPPAAIAKMRRDVISLNLSDVWIKANPARFEKLVEQQGQGKRPLAVILAQSNAILDLNLADQHHLLTDLPVLVVHGSKDQIVPVLFGQMIYEGIAGACDEKQIKSKHIEIVEEAGHFIYEMNSSAAVSRVTAFLDKTDLASKL
ncbi:Alpha/Beta hydrolase protein [Cladochytrium replicatum]|nr:Alpha/Beta hydrolase protein [Cladochytrium replicatum]